MTIAEYIAESGQVTLETPLEKYHFGAQESTADQYSGIDMRGEVMLLTRSIMITASYDTDSSTKAHPEAWGCQMILSDFFEPDNFEYREANIDLNYVSLYNCSQTDTLHAAMRFDNAISGKKVVRNSALASGSGQGVHFTKSQNIEFVNNSVFDFVINGVKSNGAKNIVFENNIVVGVRPVVQYDRCEDLKFFTADSGVDLGDVQNMVVRNNTVAGVWNKGFRLPAHKCDDENPTNTIENNVAHSISGFGVIVSAGEGSCSEFSKFYGYKNHLGTVHMGGGVSSHNRLKECISIDSAEGFLVWSSSHVEVVDNIVYGSQNMKNHDCPDAPDGRCSDCKSRTGMFIPTFGKNPTDVPIFNKIPKMYAQQGLWGGTSMFERNRFIGFDSKTNHCGSRQSAVGTNFLSDYHPLAHMRNNIFENTDASAMYHLDSPSQGWANLSDCGTFTCTGLYNVLVKVEGNQYLGIPSVFGVPRQFELTGNNRESTSTQVVPTCEKKDNWNAYLCDERNLGVLLFESQDPDRMDRSAQPIYIQDLDRGFDNRLNAFMDHVWDGAYTGQKREQRFPTVIDSSRNYTIEYTGTPPFKQRFVYHNDPGTEGTLVTIRYPDAGAYKVYDEF